MKITTITVSVNRTFQVKEYEPRNIFSSATVEVAEADNIKEVWRETYKWCNEQLLSSMIELKEHFLKAQQYISDKFSFVEIEQISDLLLDINDTEKKEDLEPIKKKIAERDKVLSDNQKAYLKKVIEEFND
jgi:hypothetical protein